MKWILKVKPEYKDTSIWEYNNSTVDILKYHDGVFRFKQENEKEPYNKIIKEESCDINVSSGQIFCNIPTNWLIEQNKK